MAREPALLPWGRARVRSASPKLQGKNACRAGHGQPTPTPCPKACPLPARCGESVLAHRRCARQSQTLPRSALNAGDRTANRRPITARTSVGEQSSMEDDGVRDGAQENGAAASLRWQQARQTHTPRHGLPRAPKAWQRREPRPRLHMWHPEHDAPPTRALHAPVGASSHPHGLSLGSPPSSHLPLLKQAPGRRTGRRP